MTPNAPADRPVGKAGLTRDGARTGAVTLIQRFGGALNLNVHFHMLFLDGVYVERPDGTLRFRRIGAPTSAELDALTRTLAHRIGRLLERRGLVERDAENVWLADDDGVEPAPMDSLRRARGGAARGRRRRPGRDDRTVNGSVPGRGVTPRLLGSVRVVRSVDQVSAASATVSTARSSHALPIVFSVMWRRAIALAGRSRVRPVSEAARRAHAPGRRASRDRWP